ncbi:MAG: hypothetical protein ACLGQX_13120 [Acidobacteriota bacterium]
MLKYLATLIMVLGLAFVIARHDETAALRGRQESASQEGTGPSPQADESRRRPPPANLGWDSPSGHIFRSAFEWPEGTTVWAIILTLLAIAEQTSATRHSALAARKAAEASLAQVFLIQRQIDVNIARERARISLAIREPSIDDNYANTDTWILWEAIEITNTGHSNGYIRFGAISFVCVDGGRWPLPDPNPEEFSLRGAVPPVESPTLLGTTPMEFSGKEFREIAKRLKSGEDSLICYGFLEYESMKTLWHRDFGYVWVPDSLDEHIVSRSPRDGRLFLHGSWEQDLRQKNLEYEIGEDKKQSPN